MILLSKSVHKGFAEIVEVVFNEMRQLQSKREGNIGYKKIILIFLKFSRKYNLPLFYNIEVEVMLEN